ncbi:MAG: YihY/virulence factor BrkB family protein [Microbacterium sp.]
MALLPNWVRRVLAWLLEQRIVRAFFHYSWHGGGMLSAAITFRALFAIFAAVLLGFSAAAIWLGNRPELYDGLIEALNAAIPGLLKMDDSSSGIVSADRLSEGLDKAGLAGVIAAVGLLWAALGAIRNLRDALQALAGTAVEKPKMWWELIGDLLTALGIGALLVASAVITMLGSAFVETVLGWLGLTGTGWQVLLTRAITIASTFLLDVVVVILLHRILSGTKPAAKNLVIGGLLGAAGLTVLQQLSGLFVRGANNNPLLGTFSSVVALLLWINFSAQVILIACSWIIIAEAERRDRVAERYGSATVAQRRVHSAEADVRRAAAALQVARDAERAEREKLVGKVAE